MFENYDLSSYFIIVNIDAPLKGVASQRIHFRIWNFISLTLHHGRKLWFILILVWLLPPYEFMNSVIFWVSSMVYKNRSDSSAAIITSSKNSPLCGELIWYNHVCRKIAFTVFLYYPNMCKFLGISPWSWIAAKPFHSEVHHVFSTIKHEI